MFADQWDEFLKLRAAAPEVASFFRYAFEAGGLSSGAGAMFEGLGISRIGPDRAGQIFEREAGRHACRTAVSKVAASLRETPALAPALAYALAWLRVSGSNSVLPPWVRRQFPAVVEILNRLRNLPCSAEDCAYCHQTHDPRTQLKRFFGFDAYRPEPRMADGKSLQETMVAHGISRSSISPLNNCATGRSATC
ncbi:MAG TPA: hypothetical protein VNQ90_04225 [Chthoniobacteraceae bacterium]|nr:hypothetical protein [Chthoniobacteraceae bacterium]